MIAAALAVLAALACAASSQPVFPDGVAAIAGSAAALQRGAVAPDADETSALQRLKDAASARLKTDLAESFTLDMLSEAAFAAAHVRTLQRVFAGGCPRDTAGCPRGWGSATSGACVPPADYDGWCGETDVREMSPAELEAFSWKCRASWPCAPPCKRDFAACPRTWGRRGGGVCTAPGTYMGICSHSTDFSNFTATHKAEWAAMCGVDWPCE